MTGDLSYLHPELLVEEVTPELGLNHVTLTATGHLGGDVDRGGEGRQLEEVIQQPPKSVLWNKLLVAKINISADNRKVFC